MLNIPSQAFPAPGSQQRVAPSGQSGRNKVALKPGHSLMDWIRFAKSGKDLTGLRGRLLEVTPDELQRHNRREDCWTCIRGMVYNVTPYMDYHPGGEEELMKAAGIDGTDLFDQVHRWVNYESMLKECLVGRMATKPAAAAKAAGSLIMAVSLSAELLVLPGAEVVRPYTPVDQSLVAASPPSSQGSDLYLMVKVYPDGVLSPYLDSLQIGENVSVSGPEGPFSLRPLRDVTHLYLLAAGTGFTPMARLISLALRESDSISKIQLLFFNKREEDVLWRHQLDDLAAKEERFQVEHVLSEPSDSWSGRRGRVDEAALTTFLLRPHGSRCYACVCGPSGFTEQTTGLLKRLGFSEEEYHAFQG
ncbi:PREDICTED: cytochrome b5 reductase 4 [Cyprinodon variegatus]|uniref:cytochrome b5 reductase 4 n=1 Tax=Cyprinodon variegatus TaxID=28743 RepID=UPI0007426B4F|nr:PREDICTED: cytochrome b5 reductase 4 [Cyprinodon variegatus]